MQRIILDDTNSDKAIDSAVRILQQGGLVIYPTETVYGVGVIANNAEAVSKLLSYKNRPAGMAIAVMVANAELADKYVERNSEAQQLYHTFLPGPLTVISRSKALVDSRLESELGTLGVRISANPVAARLSAVVGLPITTTSANAVGKARPYRIDTLLSQLSEQQIAKIDLILDAGVLPKNEPSTVIDTTTPVQSILREGGALIDIDDPVESTSDTQTREIAASWLCENANRLKEKPLIFLLEGDLGAGKTQFAQGLGEALQVKGIINSPTYNIMKEYQGVLDGKRIDFIHLDLWRLEKATANELGVLPYLKPQTVWAVEWAGPIRAEIKQWKEKVQIVRVLIEHSSEESRILRRVAL